MVALFDGVEAFYGVAVAGVATYAPDGVGGVEDGAAVQQHLDGVIDYLVHFRLQKYKKIMTKMLSFNFFLYLCTVIFRATKY